jgi:hypothetical protein
LKVEAWWKKHLIGISGDDHQGGQGPYRTAEEYLITLGKFMLNYIMLKYTLILLLSYLTDDN